MPDKRMMRSKATSWYKLPAQWSIWIRFYPNLAMAILTIYSDWDGDIILYSNRDQRTSITNPHLALATAQVFPPLRGAWSSWTKKSGCIKTGIQFLQHGDIWAVFKPPSFDHIGWFYKRIPAMDTDNIWQSSTSQIV